MTDEGALRGGAGPAGDQSGGGTGEGFGKKNQNNEHQRQRNHEAPLPGVMSTEAPVSRRGHRRPLCSNQSILLQLHLHFKDAFNIMEKKVTW